MLFATKLNSSCSGRNVPRVGNVRSPVKRREFRLELAESRRIVPEWTGTRTRGRGRGSRGGLELVDPPGDPPHSWRQKLTPQGTPLGELLRVEVGSLRSPCFFRLELAESRRPAAPLRGLRGERRVQPKVRPLPVPTAQTPSLFLSTICAGATLTTRRTPWGTVGVLELRRERRKIPRKTRIQGPAATSVPPPLTQRRSQPS